MRLNICKKWRNIRSIIWISWIIRTRNFNWSILLATLCRCLIKSTIARKPFFILKKFIKTRLLIIWNKTTRNSRINGIPPNFAWNLRETIIFCSISSKKFIWIYISVKRTCKTWKFGNWCLPVTISGNCSNKARKSSPSGRSTNNSITYEKVLN